jgi:hypothetical protein
VDRVRRGHDTVPQSDVGGDFRTDYASGSDWLELLAFNQQAQSRLLGEIARDESDANSLIAVAISTLAEVSLRDEQRKLKQERRGTFGVGTVIFILSAAILVSGLVSRYESYSEARAEAAGSLVAGEDLIGTTASLKPLGELAVGDTTFIAKLDPATGEVRVFPVGEFDPDWPELAKDFDDSSCGEVVDHLGEATDVEIEDVFGSGYGGAGERGDLTKLC